MTGFSSIDCGGNNSSIEAPSFDNIFDPNNKKATLVKSTNMSCNKVIELFDDPQSRYGLVNSPFKFEQILKDGTKMSAFNINQNAKHISSLMNCEGSTYSLQKVANLISWLPGSSRIPGLTEDQCTLILRKDFVSMASCVDKETNTK